jgi:hypothetical protein
VIAPLVVLRRGVDDFLVLTEEGLGERVRATLLRSRFAARCEIAVEDHTSLVVLAEATGSRRWTTECRPHEVLDEAVEPSIDDAELELLRVRAGTPRFGREIDDRVLPLKPGSTSAPSTSRKGAIPARNRSRDSTTGVA